MPVCRQLPEQTLVRESSEFIHGNFNKIEELPNSIEFNPSLLERWIDFMETSKFLALFLLFMRFSKDIEGHDLSKIGEMAKEEQLFRVVIYTDAVCLRHC